MFAIEVGLKLGELIEKRNRLGYVIGRRSAGDVPEWVPRLRRADDVVAAWKPEGLEKALAKSLLEREAMVGASDGSQRGKNCSCGWRLQTFDRE